MTLWLCLRFHQLPLQALCKEERHPVVITAKQRVVACNDAAAEHGVVAGQPASTAHALLAEQQAHWIERVPEREQETLGGLLGWSYSFSPTVQRWRDNCLLLEVGGCLTLFGGLQPLLQQIQHELTRRGFSVQPGIAETRQAAWLLSYAPHPLATDPSSALETRLGNLPLALLDEFEDQVSRLGKAGIRDFAQLLALPASALKRRSSADFRRWLDELMGHRQEPVPDYHPPAHFEDALWFGFEIRQQDELYPAMAELLHTLCDFMRHTQLATQCIHWRLLRMQGGSDDFEVRSSSAGHQPQRWLELSKLRLESRAISRDIEGLALQVSELSPQQQATEDLFTDGRSQESLQALIDRLRNRLGLQAIRHIVSRPEHLPEHCIGATTESPTTEPAQPAAAQRPFWLLAQPQPIQQRGASLFWNGPLEIVHGPERIEDGWWRSPVSRDYYIAQREDEEPVWIFQDRHSGRWYLQGLFD
jgi:protein ImuB